MRYRYRMNTSFELKQNAGRPWVILDFVRLSSQGRVNPRLNAVFSARSAQYTSCVLEEVVLRLDCRQELLGEGRILGKPVYYTGGVDLIFEVVTSQRMLRYVTDGLTPTSSTLQLDAQLSGMVEVTVDRSAPEKPSFQRLVGDPGPGESKRLPLASASSPLQIDRGQWYEKVLAPTRNEQYRYLEIALPTNDRQLGEEWKNALTHLTSAERAYAIGDDAAVFLHLRGALEALPGTLQAFLGGVSDENKRGRLDALLNKAGGFLHSGRHPADKGEEQGTFPVDHLDAAFAVDLMRVLLSHLSLILTAERHRKT